MDPCHQKFLKSLEESEGPVWLIARWLRSLGYAIVLLPNTRAREHRDWKQHTDRGDIYILAGDNARRIEVKHLSRHFTGRENWPFENKVIVCSKHSFDRAEPKPNAYVYLNDAMTHAAILKTADRNQWWVEPRYDRRYHTSHDDYITTVDSLKFYELPNLQPARETTTKGAQYAIPSKCPDLAAAQLTLQLPAM